MFNGLKFATGALADSGISSISRLRAQAVSIRGQIFIAFLAISVVTAALGGFASIVTGQAGELVAKTFDHSLMAINYARATSADFSLMEATVARRSLTVDPETRSTLDNELAGLEQSLYDDLKIAAERAQSQQAISAADDARVAVAAWNEKRLKLPNTQSAATVWDELTPFAATVRQQIDLLINHTAGNAFTYRQSALTAVDQNTQLAVLATGIALLLSALVAWQLSKHIIEPLAVASSIATSVADGNLEVPIPNGSNDELGALFASMAMMRNNIKSMMQREIDLRQSAQMRLADALESSNEGIVLVDSAGKIALANSQSLDFFPDLHDNGGRHVHDGPADELDATRSLSSVSNSTLHTTSTEEIVLGDGRHLRVGRTATRDGGYVAFYSDITLTKNQKQRLKATNELLDAALDNMSQGLCLYDADARLKVVNRRFCEIFRLNEESINMGSDYRRVLGLSIAAGNHDTASVDELLAEEYAFRDQNVTSTGRLQELTDGRAIAITRRPLKEGGWVSTYEDVTERRRAEAQVAFMARHDGLTGLANRVVFAEHVDQAVARFGRNGKYFAVFCIDLDRFKEVNDTLGHPVGDGLLRSVGHRLQRCVRAVDTVARLGGDEFAVLLTDLESSDDAEIVARRIIDTINEPFVIDDQPIEIGASIGISIAPEDGITYDKLLKNADVALYRSKSEGRNTWRFFKPEMDERLQERRTMELDLRAAIADEQLEVFYQPLFDLHKNGICGFEALLRWRHPSRGMISPVDFIPIAEDTGLIVPIGAWVLHEACKQAQLWPENCIIAVNVSAVQFKDGRLRETVMDALAESGLSPDRLELEVTESVLLAQNDKTLSTLGALREAGIRISMDDFGTGYSSLSYLQSFPFDKIKIDQSFVRTLSSKAGSKAIVRAVVALGASLSITTIAEGVETFDELEWLQGVGCDQIQGYYFSRPVPASEIPGLFLTWKDGVPTGAASKSNLKRLGQKLAATGS